MEVRYVNSQSNEKPSEIDITTSSDGVYIRRDIREIQIEQEDGTISKMFNFQEAFLTKSEYEIYVSEMIANKINGNDNSQAFASYQNKLNTPIEYTNGYTYKPKWAETVYAGLLQKGALLPQLFPLKIYDSTEKEERAQIMTMQELTALSIFLAQAQERFFAEYKAEKTSI